MTENERKLWKAVDQINGQIEVARTCCFDTGLLGEPEFTTLEGLRFEAELNALIQHGAMARLMLRKILNK